MKLFLQEQRKKTNFITNCKQVENADFSVLQQNNKNLAFNI